MGFELRPDLGRQRVHVRHGPALIAQIRDWVLSFPAAEIGPMNAIADETLQILGEGRRHLAWIGQELVFIRLQPAQAVADDDARARKWRQILPCSVRDRS